MIDKEEIKIGMRKVVGEILQPFFISLSAQ
jgi:hypothetical protein